MLILEELRERAVLQRPALHSLQHAATGQELQLHVALVALVDPEQRHRLFIRVRTGVYCITYIRLNYNNIQIQLMSRTNKQVYSTCSIPYRVTSTRT